MRKRWMGYALVALSVAPMLYACERLEKARQIGQALERAFKDMGTTTPALDEVTVRPALAPLALARIITVQVAP